MNAPINHFKKALLQDQALIGLWLGLANSYTAELIAGAGFDWLLIDGEHAPNDQQQMLSQLQTLAAFNCTAIIRPVWPDAVRIKQILDLGAQTILAPMIETAAQAADVVKASHYPPAGIRGVGSALARASQFNRCANYLQTANEQICVLVQIETTKGVENLADILAVDGVDGVFIGPADLSAAMGHIGNPTHPEVQKVITDSITMIKKAGKAPGILMADKALAHKYIELGAQFVAVGSDTGLLMKASSDLLSAFKKESRKADTHESVSIY